MMDELNTWRKGVDMGVGLRLDDVSYRYPRQSRNVLTNFSLTFRPGATALLRRNGAGKSTVLSILATHLFPEHGHVGFDGAQSEGKGDALTSYRRQVAWLPQNIVLIPGFTVRESVVYAGWLGGMSWRQADDKADTILKGVSLAGKSDEPAKSLSGDN